MSNIKEKSSEVHSSVSEKESMDNLLYQSFESREKEGRFRSFILEISSIMNEINHLSDRIKLNDKARTWIKTIHVDFLELEQLFNDEQADNLNDYQAIIKNFKNDLEHLKHEVKQLPYSDNRLIHSLCEAINQWLNKVANYLLNGPVISEGVYIDNPSKSHHFNFFHPAKSITNSLADLSDQLNTSFSK